MKRKRVYFALLIPAFLVWLLLSFWAGSNLYRKFDFEVKVVDFQAVFIERQNNAQTLIDNLIDSLNNKGVDFFKHTSVVDELYNRFYEQGEVVFYTSGDSLLFLSHNALPIDHYQLPQYNRGVFHLNNGWYQVVSQKHDDQRLWVASLIKNDYRYKNQFLVNAFYPSFHLPDYVDLVLDAAQGIAVYDSDNNYVLSLFIPSDSEIIFPHKLLWLLSIFWALLAIVTLFVFVYYLFNYFAVRNLGWFGLGIGFAILFVVKTLLFKWEQPFIFYQGTLFTAHHFAASNWLPSLGDLFLNLGFLSFFLWMLFSKREKLSFRLSDKFSYRFALPLLLTIPAIAAWLVAHHLKGLVLNSNLNLNVDFIFSPDIYNVLGFLTIALIFVSFYFLSALSFGAIKKIIVQHSISTVSLGLAALSILFVFYIVLPDTFYVVWLLLFGSSFLCLIKTSSSHITVSFTRLIIVFFFFSVAGTYALNLFNQQKEKSKRQNVALRLASEQDPVAEYLFSEFQEDLFSDYFLFQLIENNPYDEEGILNYLKTEYFNEYWAKYDIQLTVCAPNEVLFFKPFDQELVCDEYFEHYINERGRFVPGETFIYIDNNTGRNSYISRLPVMSSRSNSRLYNLYIEFEARFIPRELGFPELLVDEKIDISRNLGNYSYALYKDDLMTLKYGPFFYSINSSVYNIEDQAFKYLEFDNFSHLLYQRDENTLIIVSKPRESILERIAPFSYIFITLFLLSLLLWSSVLVVNKEFRFSLNFKKRLQFSVIGIVLISVVAIGSASAWFIYNIYKNKNESIINEKAHSILIEMENLLADEPQLDASYHDYLRQILLRLHQVFFTDINLFDPAGNLLASSRPRVFEEGLISPIMHPIAFNQLKISRKTLFVHNESIGNLEYRSIYVPLSNVQGELIAYINLPYFAQQSELRNEISYFLVAFINIYLLLLLLSVIIAFFISNFVTRPLQIIRDSISMVSFGKNNKKIEWERQDEIGQLISEYNRMIEELAVSAELLARSERESAWREMAKQVAHEIKNPLTPMRLNVQYLQRAWNDRADDWEDRLDRFTKTMVEQIDNLALIASEFSDFAKMPSAKIENIDLKQFIPETIDLYKGFDKVEIRYTLPGDHAPLLVNADKKQLLRVFNNLIKNAIQAYDKKDTARVDIYCTREEQYFKLTVTDYGGGIADELKQNIFQPYFTTKTAGMGLGLAMVKSIIESFNGHISFESKLGEGTSFLIRIPAANGL